MTHIARASDLNPLRENNHARHNWTSAYTSGKSLVAFYRRQNIEGTRMRISEDTHYSYIENSKTRKLHLHLNSSEQNWTFIKTLRNHLRAIRPKLCLVLQFLCLITTILLNKEIGQECYMATLIKHRMHTLQLATINALHDHLCE